MADASSGDGAPRPDTWFVALEVPDRVRTELVVRLGGLPTHTSELAWTRPAGWHVTLAWLGRLDHVAEARDDGSVVAERVAGVLRPAVASVPVDRPPPVLGSSAVLGRAIALSMTDPSWLHDLHDDVAAGLRRVGILAGPSAHPFRPHLTVARHRSTTPAAAIARARGELDVAVGDGVPLPVDAVAVMGSFHGDGPALHVVLARLPLPPVH